MRDKVNADQLLEWYDANARQLPWRVGPANSRTGKCADPYHVWLSEIMLQQTQVATVQGYFRRFIHKWPSVQDLAEAPSPEVMAAWAGLGYYARARNLIKCAQVVSGPFNGHFPRDYKTLLSLPGVGPYTAAAISAIAFDRAETVVDGNVIRVISRVFAVESPLPLARGKIGDLAARLTPDNRPGDYAQAIMDLGACICTPRSPDCQSCPWQVGCKAHAQTKVTDYPRKMPKAPKPTRTGLVYVTRRTDGAWLLETRPARGLLGGMLGWPCSDWGDEPQDAPPVNGQWQDPGLVVKHTFTHFHLTLGLRLCRVPRHCKPVVGNFISANEFSSQDLPTVMRKAYDLAQSSGFFQELAHRKGTP